MMPYSAYQLYQAERTKSVAEMRRADEQLGEFSRTLSSAWHHVSQPTGALLALLGRPPRRDQAESAELCEAGC